MAIAVDQANAGTAANDVGGTSLAVTTTQTVSAGGFIVASVGWWHASGTLSSLSGGGLTWAIAIQRKHATNNVQSAVVYAQAPSGLASSTALTANFSTTVNGRQIGISSFTGVATSSPVDTTASSDNGGTISTPWTATATITAGSLLIAAAHADDFRTSTITGPSIEALDWTDGANTSETTGYRIEAAGGSYTVAGTWSGNCSTATAAAAFLAASGGGGGGTRPSEIATPRTATFRSVR